MLEDFFLGNKKVWEVGEPDTTKVNNISGKLRCPSVLSKVLVNRGLTNFDDIKTFLKPSIKELNDPMLLIDMDIAVSRILKAKESGENVIIYGDYDVDGIAATSILYMFLSSISIDVSYYIPDRFDEGYGISESAVDYITDNHFDLMITVDCGITAKNRIEQIKQGVEKHNHNIDIIVTDHHQPDPENLPNVLAIINPHLPKSKYPFKNLCGAGVAFKLVQALCIKLCLGDKFLEYVDLACLGTIADIVEVSKENRVIVWAGLKKIQKQPNLGIKALLNTIEIKNKEIDSYMVAFLLAPRINAAGRMGDASRGVRLFTSLDPVSTEMLANELHRDNSLRQKIQEEIYQKALDKIENDSVYEKQKVIVVDGENWHQGVIGIVASKLVEHYCKPCFVISICDDIATCSARSIEGFNIFQGMEYCSELLIKYGGHEQAGGFTVRRNDIQNFREKVNEFANQVLKDKILPKLKVDSEVKIDEIDIDAAEALMIMSPFGEGNPMPLFKVKEVNVLQKRRIGTDGAHLQLVVGTNSSTIQAVAFRMGHMEPVIEINSKLDLIAEITVNEYMNRRNVQLIVKAIRMPEQLVGKNRILHEAAEKVECLDINNEWIYNRVYNQLVSYQDITLSREELGMLYRYLYKIGNRTFTKWQLFQLAQKLCNGLIRMNYFKVLSGMFVLDELDIIHFAYREKGDYTIKVPDNIEKAILDNSNIYSFLQNLQQVAEK